VRPPSRSTRTEALVLRRFDFSETSQVGHLFTRELGRVAVLAKGIKRPGHDLRGPMDLHALAETEIRSRRGDLHLLVRYRVITGHPELRQSLPRLHGASFVSELLREGTRDLDPHPRLFDLALRALAALARAAAEQVTPISLAFALCYLREAGFSPEFVRCVVCGRTAPPGGPVRFAQALGGLLCRACAASRSLPLITLSQGARQWIAACTDTEDPFAAMDHLRVSADRRAVRALMRKNLLRVLEKELRAEPFLPG